MMDAANNKAENKYERIIKSMLDVLKDTKSDFVRIEFRDYSIIVAENETADIMTEVTDVMDETKMG